MLGRSGICIVWLLLKMLGQTLLEFLSAVAVAEGMNGQGNTGLTISLPGKL